VPEIEVSDASDKAPAVDRNRLTESSNYDEAANSSPPAYGVWRQLDPRTFETKYVFYGKRAGTRIVF
jgi:hypothetical protein